ncbi:MAG: 4-(cytidine 5'-diphospho)-2-C-methyl-D-erythritol kinase [Deltaproteobacteria bacterium]|nr:4-(cytidine 5'-diphospho)-2-C-methyl-D-erythritol kinase [Deltaproteobacteria bacterium]
MFEPVVCESHAKVNLRLEVLARRDDGYHLLQMINARIALADRIRFEPAESGIALTCSRSDLPCDETNLAWRAAAALFEHAGYPGGVRIHIDKRIPVAAGLGGGSGNAACVLASLNELLGLGVSDRDLSAIGLRLGADVPFFLFGKPAVVRGIGEDIEPFEVAADIPIALLNPGVGLSTADVYRRASATLDLPKKPSTLPRRLNDAEEVAAEMHNDLEAPARALCPAIDDLLAHLRDRDALAAMVSGSGPSVFGVFATHDAARAAVSDMPDGGWLAIATRTI